nr:thiamine pyrophosphate-dependent enzyme [Salsipaludibacter albus]
MVRSRLLDVAARRLQARGHGFYTIASAGHELTAVVGAQLRRTDPCLLHYRDGGLVMAKSRTHPDPDHDVLAATVASFVAAADEPASGGRHKVWGDPATWIVPQTSTIGSHPPKAVGMAAMLARAARLEEHPAVPADAIVVTSLGDASANHATTLSALTAARWAHRHGNPVPVLVVVEDNGRGISVPTPRRWIADSLSHLPGLAFHDVGEVETPVEHAWEVVATAVEQVRTQRRPAILRLPCVRLGGHAGSDVEAGYRRRRDIDTDLDTDPLVAVALRLCGLGLTTSEELREVVAATRARLDELVADVGRHRHLASADEVMAPMAPHRPDAVRADAVAHVAPAGDDGPPTGELTLAQGLNGALREQLVTRPETLVFGEDVAVKGGVYGVTKGLQDLAGRARVFDTLLDETTILGTAQGAGLLGLLPFPEVQYLAYLHNALDQLRGEAASTRFFSDGAFATPMVLRVAGLAYQKGFGGHFHNDNAIGALRDVPGLRLAVPTRADDAVGMVRAAAAMASVDGDVVVVLEPIALYHRRDLHAPDDGAWTSPWPGPDHVLLPGELGIRHPEATDVAVVTWGNGVPMTLEAARRLGDGAGIRVIDLRWLAPLPLAAVRDAVADCAAVLVADEARATGGGIADAVVADLARHGWDGGLDSVASRDSYVPLGPAADHVLLGVDDIHAAVLRLLDRT